MASIHIKKNAVVKLPRLILLAMLRSDSGVPSIVWRLNSRNDIEKVEGTSKYRLPQTNEPSDDKLGGEASEGSLFNPDPEAHGVKAAPGGGP